MLPEARSQPTPETVSGGEEVGRPGLLGCVSALTEDHALRPDSVSPPARGLPCRGRGLSGAQSSPSRPPRETGRPQGEAVVRAQTCGDGGAPFGSWGLSAFPSVRTRPGRMAGLAAEQAPPLRPSPPRASRPLTVGGREVDGHGEVDLGPRGRTAGSYRAAGAGGGARGGRVGSQAHSPLLAGARSFHRKTDVTPAPPAPLWPPTRMTVSIMEPGGNPAEDTEALGGQVITPQTRPRPQRPGSRVSLCFWLDRGVRFRVKTYLTKEERNK